MTNEITIYDIKVPTKREEVSNRDNINQLLEAIRGLDKTVLSFETKEDIAESKKFKTHANKFIKEFKEFCDPLEEEGRAIAKTRSEVKLTLEKIVEDKLAPIYEREKKLAAIKDKLFVPSSDITSCQTKLDELNALDGYEWFGLREDALKVIDQSKTFLNNELIGFEKAAKEKAEAEEKARLENEQRIRNEAEARAKAEAQRAIDEASKRAEQAKIDAENAIKRAEEEVANKAKRDEQERLAAEAKAKANELAIANNKEHQAKIHNEIVQDLMKFFDKINEEQAKDIVRLFAMGKIRNLFIKY